MKSMNGNTVWKKPTHMLSYWSLNLRAFFCTTTFTPKFSLIHTLIVYTRENNTSPLCISCTLVLQIIPLSTLTFIGTQYEESTPWETTLKLSSLQNLLILYNLIIMFTNFYRLNCVALANLWQTINKIWIKYWISFDSIMIMESLYVLIFILDT